jgi:hypothetical protein
MEVGCACGLSVDAGAETQVSEYGSTPALLGRAHRIIPVRRSLSVHADVWLQAPKNPGNWAPGLGGQISRGPEGPLTHVCASQRPSSSDVVVELKLVGVWAQPDRVDLVFPLPVDPRLNEVGSKDIALEQVVVVFLEGVQNLGQ